MDWDDLTLGDYISIFLSIVGIILTILLAVPALFGITIPFFGTTLIPTNQANSYTVTVPGQGGSQTTTSTVTLSVPLPALTVTQTVTTSNTLTVSNLQSSITSLQSVTSALQSTSSVMQNQITTLNQQVVNLQLVDVNGRVNLTGWPGNSVTGISFTWQGETYSVAVKDGVYSIQLPKGGPFTVEIQGTGWFGSPWTHTPTPLTLDLTNLQGKSENANFSVSA